MTHRGRGAPIGTAPVPHGTREEEIALYQALYGSESYGMGRRRKESVQAILTDLRTVHRAGRHASPEKLSAPTLLDVSTGRGETLRMANDLGFRAFGTEAVTDLCGAFTHGTHILTVVMAQGHALPFEDGEFDHVTCFDVLEHLVEADVVACLGELRRVARVSVTASASERPSVFGDRDLHISKRPAAEWEALMAKAWGGATRIRNAGGSPCWQYLIPME